MQARHSIQLSLAGALLPLLISCGGSSYELTASTASSSNFVASYNAALATPQAAAANFVDLFDDAFLDGGDTKPQLLDKLQQDSANVAVLPLDSIHPALSIADAVLSACDDASGVCLLTASYVNAEPDGTRATVAVPVRFKDGKFRLYGDQKPV